jgi:hypothetical protein
MTGLARDSSRPLTLKIVPACLTPVCPYDSSAGPGRQLPRGDRSSGSADRLRDPGGPLIPHLALLEVHRAPAWSVRVAEGLHLIDIRRSLAAAEPVGRLTIRNPTQSGPPTRFDNRSRPQVLPTMAASINSVFACRRCGGADYSRGSGPAATTPGRGPSIDRDRRQQ